MKRSEKITKNRIHNKTCLIVGAIVCCISVLVMRFVGVGTGEIMKFVRPKASFSRYDRFSMGAEFAGGGPSVSPDGRYFVYSSPQTNQGDIYRANRDGTHQAALTSNSACDVDPQYSPDGRSIAFVRQVDKIGHIWLMNADGTGQRQLTFGTTDESGPLFLSDGRHILFTREADGRYDTECWSIDLDRSRLELHKGEPYATDAASVYKKWVCCVDSEGIIVVGINGKGRKLIGTGDSPAFSPDGQTIVYLDDPYDQSIYSISVDGGSKRKIITLPSTLESPTFANGGDYVLFVEKDRTGTYISQVRIDGSDYKKLFIR